MDTLDDTDRQILELLLEDARRPYSEIGDAVDLSGPAVSDRIERLQERGLLRRFTVELDRQMLRDGVSVLVELRVDPDIAADVGARLDTVDAVEHVLRTVDARLLFTATVPEADVTSLLEEWDLLQYVREFDVRVLADTVWSPSVGSAELAPTCVECGNTVDDEGTSRVLDGTEYYFCCESCETQFLETYDQLRDGI
ncbi:AsnC family transcriptional regulator [Halomicrobium katesii]|uniref:AsnC family transcriptional regulator n=1 Tax=Halomicrobium katesii TaxID=437163 RepID=UPI000369D18E|nr:AsnC family transcriptional regulator [Halomicrobium katesii]